MCTGGTCVMVSGVLEGRWRHDAEEDGEVALSPQILLRRSHHYSYGIAASLRSGGRVDFLKGDSQANASLCMIMIGVNIWMTLNEHDPKRHAPADTGVRSSFAPPFTLAFYQLFPFSLGVGNRQ